MSSFAVLTSLLFVVGSALAGPFDSALRARQATNGQSSGLTVDLGYEIYKGYYNATSKLNIWKGYAWLNGLEYSDR